MPSKIVAQGTNNFPNLSIKDLIEARDLFHVHLMNKKNVIATAVGKYLLRFSDLDKNDQYVPAKKFPRPVRTLINSKVVPEISWPCILVFVDQWQDEAQLIHDNGNNIIPKSIYMPDGRIIPICVVEASKAHITNTEIDETKLMFPKNLISGGFPLVVYSQNERRVASVGCVVSDGNKFYALTNKHVAGKKGTEVFSVLKNEEIRIGVTSGKQLGKGKFSDLYPGWVGANIMINNDVGLVELDDVTIWKTEVFGIGTVDELYDANTFNFNLDLITKKVVAYGAVSKDLSGQVVALFYRYKSVGGIEYVSDFLIGGNDGTVLDVHHGDSGTLWLLEEKDERTEKILRRPLAVHWGQHEFIEAGSCMRHAYVLATCLSNVCRELDVDIVRGWNIDQEYTWAKTGHFKIAARSCDLVTEPKLVKLLKLNKKNIGYTDEQLQDAVDIAKAKSEGFIPLADVPDLWWRYKRFKTEGSNHFADMDESNDAVENGKDLLTLCKQDSFIDIKKWIGFYQQLDAVDPKTKIDRITKEEVPAPREGAVPFRVWQMYTQMVNSVKAKKIDEFICAGGTLTHYVGDACQPLHVSYLHAGIPGHETKVHGDYEDKLIDANMTDIFEKVNGLDNIVKASELVTGGKAAARLVIELMRATHKTLPPMDIINAFDGNTGSGKYERAWKVLGTRTIKVIANGAHVMAVLWQSAWIEGGGKNIAQNKIAAVKQPDLQALYKNFKFVQSFTLTQPKFELALNEDSRTL